MLCHTTSDFPGRTISFSSPAFKPSSDRLGIVHPRAQAQHKARCQTKELCVVMQSHSPCSHARQCLEYTARVENWDVSAVLPLPGP